MYLHLGQDVVVRSRDIIGIFDIENTSVSKIRAASAALSPTCTSA